MTTELRLHRILKAPRDLVWKCWTTPDLLLPWFCPRPHRTVEAIIDLRPGGRFFTRMLVEGKDYPGDGSYLHVDPGRRLVFTDLMLADWQPVATPGLGFTAELIFADHPEGTDYTAIARHATPEVAASHERMGFSEGWGTVATQLEEFAQTLAAGGGGTHMVLERVIDAPPSAVWGAWSDPAVLPTWFGPDGFSCRTDRIDLRQGGEWVFDMIGPDGKVWPNRHRFTRWDAPSRIDYTLDDQSGDPAQTKLVVITFTPEGAGTRVTLDMTMPDAAYHEAALKHGADKLGLETLAKLAAVAEARAR